MLVPAHALPLIHFTATLLPPEGEVDNVSEKAMGAFPILSLFSLHTSPHLLLPHGLPNCMMFIRAPASTRRSREQKKLIGMLQEKRGKVHLVVMLKELK